MSRARAGGSGAPAGVDTAAVAAFLRELADRAESDVALARHLGDALRASGLLDGEAAMAPRAPRGVRRPGTAAAGGTSDDAHDILDPFAVLRAEGEAALRQRLDAADVPALRAIIRANRLDPHRVSARWTARDRLAGLIVEQVKARANLGRAFERV